MHSTIRKGDGRSSLCTQSRRYGGLDLSGITIRSFVALVTFLPLPDIRTLARNTAALRKADSFFEKKQANARWGTYYTHLTACNTEWAQRFFDEMQTNLKAADSGLKSFHIQTAVQDPSSLEVLQNRVTSSLPESVPVKQNGTDRHSDNHLSEKIQLNLRALRAKEKAWGPEHVTTLDTVNDLGKLHAEQGKVVEAEEMYVRALSGFEKTLGTRHDRTLKVSVDLQELYFLAAAQETSGIQ